MKQLFFLGLGAFFFAACNKDKFETKPQLKIESLSSDFVPQGQALNINFSFTDKEGDVDDTLYVVRTRLNQRGPYTDAEAIEYKIPSFPDQQSGEIRLTMPYALGLTFGISPVTTGGIKELDTLSLKFVVMDKEKNKSDTAIANVIVER
jgi:hypothetical protein